MPLDRAQSCALMIESHSLRVSSAQDAAPQMKHDATLEAVQLRMRASPMRWRTASSRIETSWPIRSSLALSQR